MNFCFINLIDENIGPAKISLFYIKGNNWMIKIDITVLSETNKLKLISVPGQNRIERNDKVDELAHEDRQDLFYGPDPIFELRHTVQRTI